MDKELVAHFVEHVKLAGGYQGPRMKRGKGVFRFKGDRPKTVHGLYGPVTLTRAYYASGSCATWVPGPQRPVADRQRHRGKRLQARGRRADEGERNDLDSARSAAHAPALRIDHEFTLCPRPPTLPT